MDLSSSSTVLLTPESGIAYVNVQQQVNVPQGAVGLLLGRASMGEKGLIVSPGLVHPSQTPLLKVAMHSPKGTILIREGDPIAQFLLLPTLPLSKSQTTLNSQQGFRDSHSPLIALQLSLDQRPMASINVNGRSFKGLLDTGADQSVIKSSDWPSHWPVNQADKTLQGLGAVLAPNQSAVPLHWRDDEGHQGDFTPFVLPVPVNLWGRDVLTNMELTLTNVSPTAQKMMHKQGYRPGKGLGRNLQGHAQPIDLKPKLDRKGLGFS